MSKTKKPKRVALAADLEAPDRPPTFCPFCGGKKILVNMVEWAANSLEPCDLDNKATLGEHQCDDCDGRSFWS